MSLPLYSADTIIGIIIAVILSVIFIMRGYLTFLRNPVYAIVLIVILIIVYIIMSAINLAYGFSDAIDTQILALSEVLK